MQVYLLAPFKSTFAQALRAILAGVLAASGQLSEAAISLLRESRMPNSDLRPGSGGRQTVVVEIRELGIGQGIASVVGDFHKGILAQHVSVKIDERVRKNLQAGAADRPVVILMQERH